MPRYLYHVAPASARNSIRRFGLLPDIPKADGPRYRVNNREGKPRRGVYATRGQPEPGYAWGVPHDVYRIELPRGFRTYFDPAVISLPEGGRSGGSARVIPRRVPPAWLAVVAENR